MTEQRRPIGRKGRTCSRAGCRQPAIKTLTYIYADSTAVLGPLAIYAEPHSYDLCDIHAGRMSVPQGWNVIKESGLDSSINEPSEDDLMAIADAIREVGRVSDDEEDAEARTAHAPELGRRGHLRAIPND